MPLKIKTFRMATVHISAWCFRRVIIRVSVNIRSSVSVADRDIAVVLIASTAAAASIDVTNDA